MKTQPASDAVWERKPDDVFKMIFLIKIKIGFFWGICNKLLEENKPCNEVAIFKTFVKIRLESEYHAAFEQPEREKCFI